MRLNINTLLDMFDTRFDRIDEMMDRLEDRMSSMTMIVFVRIVGLKQERVNCF